MSVFLGVLAAREEKSTETRERRYLRSRIDHFSLSDESFSANFRLNKEAFRFVLSEIAEHVPDNRNGGLSTEQKLAAVLRFLAEGSYQRGVGNDHHVAVAQPTLSKILSEVLEVMERQLCPKFIVMAMTEQEKDAAKTFFYEKCAIPGVVMCVDGTHVKILPPSENRELYLNRKGFYSLNVMIICDDRQKIRCVDPRFQGSNHDSHIWRASAARAYFEDLHANGDRNTKLLGDAGYPAEPWLITPFRAAQEGTEESAFNKRHSKGRMIVERTIGVLKNRFRCLLGARQLHYTPLKAARIVNVCSALHNFCIDFNC